MQRLCLIAALTLAGALNAAGGSLYTIHEKSERFGTPKTNDGTTGQTRRMTISITAFSYHFEIRAASTAPETANAEWVVLTKDSNRAPQECARGTATLSFPKKNRRATIDTGRVQIPVGTDESRNPAVYGYGIRLMDSKGQVLEEKYSPAGARNAIRWTPGEKAPPAPPPRPAVPMPVVY